jgi:CBS domain-containing membrane protein
LAAWCREFRPAPLTVDRTERLRIAFGALLGLGLTALLVAGPAGWAGPAQLIAPLGASAVLVFAVPASPLAQPWAVVGGNTLSALVGVACARWLGGGPASAALAVAAALLVMFALRCLHPPGGASALLAVLSGAADPAFALVPVALDSALLVAIGIAFHRLTGKRYPHGPGAAPTPAPVAAGALPPTVTDADLAAVLRQRNEVLDVSADDLRSLVEATRQRSLQRRLGALRCADIMSTDLATVHFGTPLHEAWDLMRSRGVKALPVVDRARRIVGIVTRADVLRQADLERPDGLRSRLREVLRPSGQTHSDRPEVVGQIMTRQVRVASADRPIAELVPLFSSTGHHHLPILDGEQRLVGMVTQSDLVAALARLG